MNIAAHKRSTDEMRAVVLKAFGTIMAEWNVSIPEAAALADVSEST